jgi:hypothetical protein
VRFEESLIDVLHKSDRSLVQIRVIQGQGLVGEAGAPMTWNVRRGAVPSFGNFQEHAHSPRLKVSLLNWCARINKIDFRLKCHYFACVLCIPKLGPAPAHVVFSAVRSCLSFGPDLRDLLKSGANRMEWSIGRKRFV